MTPAVWLENCPDYHRWQRLAADALAHLGLDRDLTGCRLLLKPNLVAARGAEDPACTHPLFVRAVAARLAAAGGKVTVGDSPAFVSARQVMDRTGLTAALADLPVRLTEFTPGPRLVTPGGIRCTLARQAADCDILINLPKIKAHDQFGLTLAVKNLFGTVVGLEKPLLHLRLGQGLARFLGELPALLPPTLTLADGIVAMHGHGPTNGDPLALGLVGAGDDPFAVDRAIVACLRPHGPRLPMGDNPHQAVRFPRRTPAELELPAFSVPATLAPVRFSPPHVLASLLRRLWLRLRPSSHHRTPG